MMKLLLLAIYCCSCMALGESVFHIKPGGVVAGEMEMDILGEKDGDKGFDENVPVKRKTWSLKDVVIPQTGLKCGDYLFLRDGADRWLLMDREGNKVGKVYVCLFKTEREARKLLKNELLSPNRMTLKDVWGREGTCCIFRDMEKSPKNLLYATRGNLAFSISGPRERDVWDVKLAESVLDFFLDRTAWVPVDEREVAAALAKRKARLLERERQEKEREKKEEEARELEKWKKEPCYGMPPLCDKVMAYDSSQAPVELLKHEESLSTQLVSPNIHQGRITLAMLKKWGGKLFWVESEGCRRNGVYVKLSPSGDMEKRMEQGSHVEILVAYARNRKEAMDMLLKVRFYDPRKTNRDPRDVAASTVIKPGKVGDFDLGCGGVLGADGALVKGSDQSAVYFLRGNTAVMVLSTDPGYSVMGLARKLDAALNDKKGSAVSESK